MLRICMNCQKYRRLYTDMTDIGLGFRWYGDGRCQVVPFHASMRKPTDHCEMFTSLKDAKGPFRCYEEWDAPRKDLDALFPEKDMR